MPTAGFGTLGPVPLRYRAFLPRGLRVPAAVVAVLAALVVVVLGIKYAGDDSAGRVDGHLDQAVDALPHLRLATLASFGAPAIVVVLAFLIAIGCLIARWWRAALLVLGGPGLTGLVTTFGKPLVDRTIGHHGGLAYPSGHTGGATSLTLVVVLLVAAALQLGAPATAVVAGVCAVVAGGVVGTGMVVRGAHYPTDVIGGFCTAVACVTLVVLVIDTALRRRVRPRASVPAHRAAV